MRDSCTTFYLLKRSLVVLFAQKFLNWTEVRSLETALMIRQRLVGTYETSKTNTPQILMHTIVIVKQNIFP